MKLTLDKLIICGIILLIGGCAISPPLKSPVEGWPKDLVRTETTNASKQVELMCGASSLGCTWVNLCQHTCDKYYSDSNPAESLREHEEGHCQGRDHVFSSTFQDLYDKYKVDPSFCTGSETQEELNKAKVKWDLMLIILI